MKKFATILLTVFVLCYGGYAGAKHFWRGETMSVSSAEKRWGKLPFDPSQFQSASPDVRAKMAVTFILSKQFIGKTVPEVRSQLGDWDGYYFRDSYPAYIIRDGRADKGETWQVVFLLSKDRIVDELIVHKNN